VTLALCAAGALVALAFVTAAIGGFRAYQAAARFVPVTRDEKRGE
jgi:hypothetical protein